MNGEDNSQQTIFSMQPSHKMKDKNYKTIGYCIFCIDRALPPRELTEEHIIANALGGTLRFKEAACRQCAETMNKRFEQPSLNADFYVPRLLLQLRAKGKETTKKLPPVALGKVDISKPGSEGFDTYLTREQYPKVLQFLVFGEPGKIVGKVYGGIESIQLSLSNISNAHETIGAPLEAAYRTPIMPYEFGMAIIKIAYSYAVAECGIETFDGTEIRELLAYRREDIRNFFGCPENYIKRKMHFLHHLSWSVIKGYIVVKVHLFASYGIRPYIVVVGRHIKYSR